MSALFLLIVSVSPFIPTLLLLAVSRSFRILSSSCTPSSLALNSMNACYLSIAYRFCLIEGSSSFLSSSPSAPVPSPSSNFSDLMSLASSASAASFAAASSASLIFCSCSFWNAFGSDSIYLLIASIFCCVFLY